MSPVDLAGWVASALTLMTFVSGDMRRLRMAAIGANFAFIGYGAAAGLWPVLALHLALAPINLWRLAQLRRAARVKPPLAAVKATATATDARWIEVTTQARGRAAVVLPGATSTPRLSPRPHRAAMATRRHRATPA